jgi:uncharacterized protein
VFRVVAHRSEHGAVGDLNTPTRVLDNDDSSNDTGRKIVVPIDWHTVPVSEAPPETLWVHPHLDRKSSTIDGEGLISTSALPADVIVVRLAGRLVSSDELGSLIERTNADPSAGFVDTVMIYEDAHLVLPPGSLIHFGNHSCDPNLWHVGPYEISTRRPVEPGDELTIDYGTHSAEGFSMACRCGSPLCRGIVSGDDWRLPALQDRYRNHWVPALEDRISAT